MGLALHALGVVAHVEGRYEAARALLEESVALSVAISYRWHIAPVLTSLARTLHALGAVAEALQTFLEALAAAHDARTTGQMIEAVLGLAAVLDDQGAKEPALELCLHILQHPMSSPKQRAQAEQLCSQLQGSGPAQEVTLMEERARDTTLEMVVAELIADYTHPGVITSSHV